MKTIDAEPGEHIYHASLRAIEEAKKVNTFVRLVFNETKILVYPVSFVNDIMEKYEYQRKLNWK